MVRCKVYQLRHAAADVVAEEFSNAVSFADVLVPWVGVPETLAWRDVRQKVFHRRWLDYIAQISWGCKYSENQTRVKENVCISVYRKTTKDLVGQRMIRREVCAQVERASFVSL